MKFALAALMATATQGINLNNALFDEEFVQATAEIAAREGSGVRARWVELPDCSIIKYSKATAGDGTLIPLEADLSNAIIATCKHYNWTANSKTAFVQVADEVNPEDVTVLQITKPSTWVELPDCSGKKGEIVLAFDKANASVATCKTRPTGAPSYASN